MNTRWVIAAAGALGVGVLTASALLGPTTHVRVQGSDGDPERSTACQADKQANLDFTVKDMHGAKVRLADYKGKVILINFWATWCAPCQVEIPGFIELYDQVQGQGIRPSWRVRRRRRRDAADVCGEVENQLPDARRPRRE